MKNLLKKFLVFSLILVVSMNLNLKSQNEELSEEEIQAQVNEILQNPEKIEELMQDPAFRAEVEAAEAAMEAEEDLEQAEEKIEENKAEEAPEVEVEEVSEVID